MDGNKKTSIGVDLKALTNQVHTLFQPPKNELIKSHQLTQPYRYITGLPSPTYH
jgi:hypothetical protein